MKMNTKRIVMIHFIFLGVMGLWSFALFFFLNYDIKNIEGEVANLHIRNAFENMLKACVGTIVFLWAVVSICLLSGRKIKSERN